MKKKANNARVKKNLIVLLGIFVVAGFLRLYRIESNFVFSGEIGHNLLAIKNAYLQRTIPLLGPPTSHPWLSFAPLFYWLYGPVLYFSGFHPLSHAYFGVFVSLALLLANYSVIRRLFSERAGLLSTTLLAISPLFLEFARQARFFSIVSLLVYPFLYFLYRVMQGEKHYLIWLGFIFGAMLSFHFTPLMLVPLVIVVLVGNKIRLRKHDVISLLGGFIIPMIPFFLYDMTHGFAMTKNVVLWIPYRVAGFFGLYPKNTVSAEVVQENVLSLTEFFTKSFLPVTYGWMGLPLMLGVLCFSLYRSYVIFKKTKQINAELLIYLWFWLGYLAVFIHGSPPIHYFVPILSAPIVIASICIDRATKTKFNDLYVFAAIAVLFVINNTYFFSSQWFYMPSEKLQTKPYVMPYLLQREITKQIITDAKGKPFELHRVGQDDQFEGDYAQNYMYLLWWAGNEPQQHAKVRYTIYENQYQPLEHLLKNDKIFKVSNITIIKDRL